MRATSAPANVAIARRRGPARLAREPATGIAPIAMTA